MSKKKQHTSQSDYDRPAQSIHDKLTDEDIEDMLEDYEEVTDIHSVPRKTHIRYFTVIQEDGIAKKVFRIGGNLLYASPDNEYVILSNGDKKWSVQNIHSIYYRQLTIGEIKDEYEEILDDYEREINELKMINRKLYKKLTGIDNKMSSDIRKQPKYHEDKTDLNYVNIYWPRIFNSSSCFRTTRDQILFKEAYSLGRNNNEFKLWTDSTLAWTRT
mgnify:CR=1 FL=1